MADAEAFRKVALAAMTQQKDDELSQATNQTPATVDSHNMRKFEATEHPGGAGPWPEVREATELAALFFEAREDLLNASEARRAERRRKAEELAAIERAAREAEAKVHWRRV